MVRPTLPKESRPAESPFIAQLKVRMPPEVARAVPGEWIDRLLLISELEELFAEARRLEGSESFDSRLLKVLGVTYEYADADLKHIPPAGPAIVVANHPFGLLEGPVLADILSRIRHDYKLLANSMLQAIPEAASRMISLDVFDTPGAVSANAGALKRGIQWLRSGGLLVVFPAGEVSSWRLPSLAVADPGWSSIAARLSRLTGAPVVPVCFHGTNGPGFHLAGVLHPRLRTALLPRELLNKRGQHVRVSIGAPVAAPRIAALKTDETATAFLRNRTYFLQAKDSSDRKQWLSLPIPNHRTAAVFPIGQPVSHHLLRAEVGALPQEQKLVSSGENSVFVATAEQIPASLREIGRLREQAFREAGEGSGKPYDLDEFDAHYQHLFIWNRERSEILGAYRFAGTDRVLAQHGSRGLYTSSLFRLGRSFYSTLTPALELGRSFVRSESQKSYQALLLLWKGIGAYVVRNPRYRTLFGPLSISNHYRPETRDLMVSYLRTRHLNADLAPMVKPRRRFQSRPIQGCDIGLLARSIGGVDELSDLVSDVEPDKKGVPVLMRQYLSFGAEVLEFSVDQAFSDVLDGLVVVDLTRVERRLLDRYLTAEGASEFLAYHHVQRQRVRASAASA